MYSSEHQQLTQAENGPRVEHRAEHHLFPTWWWWGYAGLIALLAAAVGSEPSSVLGVGIAMFTAGAILIDLPVQRAFRASLATRQRQGEPYNRVRALIATVGFAMVLILLAVEFGLTLKTFGVPYSGSIVGAIAGIGFATRGPVLARWDASTTSHRSPAASSAHVSE